MKDLEKKISQVFEEKNSNLNIGIAKCLHGQSCHKINNPTIHSYIIGEATLHNNNSVGTPILLIPSHINREYIMNLTSSSSFLNKLEELGMSPYLLEWNKINKLNLHYSESEYISNILTPAINFIYEKHNSKVIILGHCIGGLIALAAAQIMPEKIAGLITLATPWDFHSNSFLYKINEDIYKLILENIKGYNYVPKELIHIIMNWPHINTITNKIISIAESKEINSSFFAVENWMDDHIPMTLPLFDTCIRKYSIMNQPFNKKWEILGEIIDPSHIEVSALNIIPLNDKIVPPDSQAPLSNLFKNCNTLKLNTGHIGMLISNNTNFAYQISQWSKSCLKS